MNLEPFSRIHPCGFTDLKMTQISTFSEIQNIEEVGKRLTHYLVKNLRYTTMHYLKQVKR